MGPPRLRRVAWPTYACALVVALVCTWSRPVSAQSAVVVAVAGQGPASELRARISTELATRGHKVIAVAMIGQELAQASQALERHRRDASAQAGVLVVLRGPSRVDIVVVTARGPPSARSLTAGTNLASAVALLVAEIVDVALDAPPEPISPAPPQTSPAPPHASPSAEQPGSRPPDKPVTLAWHADAAVVVAWPVRYRLPFGQAIVSLAARPHWRVRAGLEGVLPLNPLRDALAAGRLQTQVFAAGGRADIDTLPRSSPVRLDLQGGVNALAIRLRATGRERVKQTVWTGAAIVGLWLRVRVRTRVELAVGVRMTVPFERLRIKLAGELAQDLGGVWPGAGASAGWRW